MTRETLLILKNVRKYYPLKKRAFTSRTTTYVKAVDGVSAEILKGETFGLVGESGCGKSTLGRQILRLEEPTNGEILYGNTNILELEKERLRLLRRKMQIIFQDPFSSLNPRKTAGRIIEDPLIIHNYGTKQDRRDRVLSIMDEVGLRPEHISRYPHEFSGGQRQRISIARALALNPEFIICDEPVSALDVSIQAQVINLLKDLQEKYSLTYLFISHDLNLVKYVTNRLAVMYLGRFVELSKSDTIYLKPLHPYTIALLAATPISDPKRKRERLLLEGDIPSPINPPSGCHFHPRCSRAKSICKEVMPEFKEVEPDHFVRCFL
jgi:peptide/nickel transport system ATP-binding protein/oligopeptide transport system ATP-binding protein